MGKRVKTTRRPKNPPGIIDDCFKANDDWSDEDDQLTESVDDSRVELTAVLIVTSWALLQPVTSGNRKYENKF